MRGAKSTLALLAVLVGLGAYIYFVTWQQDENAGVSQQEKIFAGLEPDQVQEIRIKSDKGETTTVKRQADGWQIVEPLTARASTGEVSTLITALQGLEVTRVIDDNPTDIAEYGLASPRIEVEFKLAEGKPGGHLLIGEKTATAGNLYAKRAEDKRVLLVADYHEQSLNKATFDLRDKTIIAFKRDAVTGLDVNTDGRSFQLAKAGEDWRITKPLAVRADSSAAEGLVGRIETAQMKSLVTNQATPADLVKYGLDKPVTTVDINLGSAKATFVVGGKAGDEAFYARDASQPTVVTIEKALAEDLKKPLDDYRQKSIFEFRAYNVDRIEFTRSGQTSVFERVKSGDDAKPDSWKRISPNAKDVDREKMEELLTNLADVRAGSFQESTAGTGLDAPLLTVAARFEDGKKEERVRFGKTGSGEFAATVDPGAAKLESNRLDEIVKTLDELSK